jgi:hypothetical protein
MYFANSGRIDIDKFLHANLVRYELPLGGGLKAVISVNPQDRGFRQFLSECHFSGASIDNGANNGGASNNGPWASEAIRVENVDKMQPRGAWISSIQANNRVYEFSKSAAGQYLLVVGKGPESPLRGSAMASKEFANRAEFLHALEELKAGGPAALENIARR